MTNSHDHERYVVDNVGSTVIGWLFALAVAAVLGLGALFFFSVEGTFAAAKKPSASASAVNLQVDK